MFSVPTGRVPKLNFAGASRKMDGLATAVGAATVPSSASVKMSRFIVSLSGRRLGNIDCYLFALRPQGAAATRSLGAAL
jgi:hypothetical protein